MWRLGSDYRSCRSKIFGQGNGSQKQLFEMKSAVSKEIWPFWCRSIRNAKSSCTKRINCNQSPNIKTPSARAIQTVETPTLHEPTCHPHHHLVVEVLEHLPCSLTSLRCAVRLRHHQVTHLPSCAHQIQLHQLPQLRQQLLVRIYQQWCSKRRMWRRFEK